METVVVEPRVVRSRERVPVDDVGAVPAGAGPQPLVVGPSPATRHLHRDEEDLPIAGIAHRAPAIRGFDVAVVAEVDHDLARKPVTPRESPDDLWGVGELPARRGIDREAPSTEFPRGTLHDRIAEGILPSGRHARHCERERHDRGHQHDERADATAHGTTVASARRSRQGGSAVRRIRVVRDQAS